MKNSAFFLLLFFILISSFEADAQIKSVRETAASKAATATAPRPELAYVEVKWAGSRTVNIVIDGSSYTFNGGQVRLLLLTPGISLKLYVVLSGQKIEAMEFLLIEAGWGNLVVNIKDNTAIFTYRSSTDTERIIRQITSTLISIQGGTFIMGCKSMQGGDCNFVEKPVRQVTLSNFYIGKYEVTQLQWRVVMGANPSYFQNCDTCPVENVSWNDIQTFLIKLNALTGKNYRLPTEAEWEYAARGGNRSSGYKYSGSNALGAVAWNADNSRDKTHPVGQKSPNELGVHDMSGNVWEWCQDWYGIYDKRPQNNPIGPTIGVSRVERGGSWSNTARHTRVSYRHGNTPDNRNIMVGFRLAL